MQISAVIATSVSRVNPRTAEALLYNDVCVPGVEYIHVCSYVRGRRVYPITHFHEGIVITLCQVVVLNICRCTLYMYMYIGVGCFLLRERGRERVGR